MCVRAAAAEERPGLAGEDAEESDQVEEERVVAAAGECREPVILVDPGLLAESGRPALQIDLVLVALLAVPDDVHVELLRAVLLRPAEGDLDRHVFDGVAVRVDAEVVGHRLVPTHLGKRRAERSVGSGPVADTGGRGQAVHVHDQHRVVRVRLRPERVDVGEIGADAVSAGWRRKSRRVEVIGRGCGPRRSLREPGCRGERGEERDETDDPDRPPSKQYSRAHRPSLCRVPRCSGRPWFAARPQPVRRPNRVGAAREQAMWVDAGNERAGTRGLSSSRLRSQPVRPWCCSGESSPTPPRPQPGRPWWAPRARKAHLAASSAGCRSVTPVRTSRGSSARSRSRTRTDRR